MLILPAVDIKGGKCVRLQQGRKDAETVYSENPAAIAAKWAAAGAVYIHVIDLDGAFEKSPRNVIEIEKIIQAVEVPIQVGGGIRTLKTVQSYLEMGVSRVILGTEAVHKVQLVRDASQLYPGQIVVGIDAREGKVAVDGWTQTTQVDAVELARQYEDCGVAAIVFTDIYRDGMQTGPNLEATRRLAEAVSTPVIASGGVASMADLKRLWPLYQIGVAGVIIGRALYTGAIDLETAIHFVSQTD